MQKLDILSINSNTLESWTTVKKVTENSKKLTTKKEPTLGPQIKKRLSFKNQDKEQDKPKTNLNKTTDSY